MEIQPGVHRIEAPLGDRYIAMYVVEGDSAALLIDTGLDESVAGTLLPYLHKAGVRTDKIRYVLNTHSDFDHFGGNGAVRAAIPGALFLCHELDRPWIENVDRLIDERYREFAAPDGFDESPESQAFTRASTRTTPIDIALRGGEQLQLGNRTVQILHTPGHTWGHLTVWDTESGAALIGDAVLYNSVLTARGTPAFPPTYRYLDSYYATMQRMASLPVKHLLTAHYPVYSGADVKDFISESLSFADRVDMAIRQTLAQARTPLATLELIRRIAGDLGTWPQQAQPYLIFPVSGHLESLLARRVVRRTMDGAGHAQWQLTEMPS